jgi:acetyl-CoA carboxylase carboxyl transferase subunit alpha
MEKSEYILEFEKPLRDLDRQLESLNQLSLENKVDVSEEIAAIEKKIEATKRSIYSNLNAWQKVQIARHPKRPYALDYIGAVFQDFQELHGDRIFGDDHAIIGGPAFFEGRAVMVIGQQKGRDTKENLKRNFGCPHPEGYRKALRLMKTAERFHLPIVTLIDTPGAFPGIASEERHVAEAIAVNIREMSTLKVPIVSVVIGEGGSGGALGIGVADRVLIFENAYYSVISPEGCAAILWKDRANSPQAAEALKLGAQDLLRLEVVDEVLEEPFGGGHNSPEECFATLKNALKINLPRLGRLSPKELLDKRYEKFRAMGVYAEEEPDPAPAEPTPTSEGDQSMAPEEPEKSGSAPSNRSQDR